MVLGQAVAQLARHTLAVLSTADRAADLAGKSSPLRSPKSAFESIDGAQNETYTESGLRTVLVRQSKWKGPRE
jgi:hypothetical protein